MSKGGGEAVAMHVLEALQNEYDLTLITLNQPDFEELNDFYQTSVDPVPVRIAGTVAPWLHRQFGIKYYILQNALLGRYARRHADEFDLLFSTINELGLGSDSIQYVHFPFDWSVSLPNREHIFHPTVEEDGPYERLCTAIADIDRKDIQSNTLLANSEWTAAVVEDAYDTRPDILHPPIDTRSFDPQPWSDREPGFVTIGRIERSKRIADMIKIIDRLRERDRETHLHVIGPTVDEEYYKEVAALAADRPYIYLEGELEREELVERICSHRYGIHGKEYEHFGMAVAELVAGGCVTFVPSNGGQHEIVGKREPLLYDSVDDAVETIDRAFTRSGEPEDLRFSQREISRRFGRERFQEEIRKTVAETLHGGKSQPISRRSPSLTVEEGTDD